MAVVVEQDADRGVQTRFTSGVPVYFDRPRFEAFRDSISRYHASPPPDQAGPTSIRTSVKVYL